MFYEGNPVAVKAYLNKLRIVKNELRLPIVPISDGLMEKINREGMINVLTIN